MKSVVHKNAAMSKLFDPAKKEAARLAAAKIQAAGFKVFSYGYGDVMVWIAPEKIIRVSAEKAGEFIDTQGGSHGTQR